MARSAKKVTYKDIAREAGVSIAAVSFVLNRSGSVGPEVSERILKAVKSLGYRRNQLAQAMRTGRSKTFGLVLPDLCNPFFPELAQAIGDSARRAEYSILLAESGNGNHEREALERLASHGVDGICWCPSSRQDLPAELNLGVPVVVIDRPLPHYDVVMSNYRMGGALLAQDIRSAGLHAVGLVVGPHDMPGTDQRRDALVDALDADCTIVWEVENDYDTDLRPDVVKALALRAVDAVVCANDMIAIGVVRQLAQLGAHVPQDVAVFGFDDIPWSAIVEPALTTIRQPLREIGEAAVRLLLHRIGAPDGAPCCEELDVSLIRRASTTNRDERG